VAVRIDLCHRTEQLELLPAAAAAAGLRWLLHLLLHRIRRRLQRHKPHLGTCHFHPTAC
jgi:hypothetical protein